MTRLFENQDGITLSDSPALEPRPTDTVLPFQAAGRWKTVDAYAMRRIVPLKGEDGNIIGYRPMIQQGRGVNRKNYYEVFRITPEVDAAMALAMAQRWRDNMEAELGIDIGQISSKSASRFVPGISLIVFSKPPYRACWKWSSPGNTPVTKYMGKRLGFQASYRELVQRICEALSLEMPDELIAPTPNPSQYASLCAMGIEELPDRRSVQLSWAARQLQ